MITDADTTIAVKNADEQESGEQHNDQRRPGTLKLFPNKSEPMPGRSPLFRR